MKADYRSLARAALVRADAELDSQVDERLRYAAVELRSAMEALVYERLLLYEAELPAKELATWQPHQVFAVLLNIDEYADSSSSLSYGLQASPGSPPERLEYAGTDRALSTRELKTFYNKLSSYLHTPTVQQVRSGGTPSHGRMRTGCKEVRDIIAEVLASKVFCIDFKQVATLNCVECSSKIVCRMPRKVGESRDVECTNSTCSASYRVEPESESSTFWHPLREIVRCEGSGCAAKFGIWVRDVRPGYSWKCKQCGGTLAIVTGVTYTAPKPD